MASEPHVSAARMPVRRASFIARHVFRDLVVRQDASALRAAGRIAVVLPMVQVGLMVGLLKAETWQLLLGAEGVVVALLAHGQLTRGNVESRLAGFGIALINGLALGAAGLALGGHLLWISSVAGLLIISWLVFAPTASTTVRRAWTFFGALLALMVLVAGFARWSLESARAQPEPQSRQAALSVCWAALQLRGGNGTERALARLRQAQAAFAAADYELAFELAHDGAYGEDGRSRVPASVIGGQLLDSLMRLKAQAFFNWQWEQTGDIATPISSEPLPDDTLRDESVRVRWGW